MTTNRTMKNLTTKEVLKYILLPFLIVYATLIILVMLFGGDGALDFYGSFILVCVFGLAIYFTKPFDIMYNPLETAIIATTMSQFADIILIIMRIINES